MSKKENNSLVPSGLGFLPNLIQNIGEKWNNLSTGDKFFVGGMTGSAIGTVVYKFFGGLFEHRYRMDIDFSKKKFSLRPSGADDEWEDS